ncbi:glutamate receptor ionotropic, delta-2-like [Culex pipiens pallens]|uniref:glutamate receptor ionotropic, delta-2-like n=1 Tax=Culex pipiens pallens TaxID=42434 RepID=UPI0022AB2D93|nr:glutamate receptor ionotropic, delta-2-like [Culex pipiens pallens]
MFNYFTDLYCTCFISNANDIDFELHFELSQPVIWIDIENVNREDLLSSIENGCQSFILTENSWLTFFDLFWYLHDRTVQRFANKKVLIELDYDSEYFKVESIFEHVVVHDIPQLVVIVQVEDDRIDVVTNKFTGRDTQQEVILLDSYIPSLGTFLYGNDLFPDKLLDLKGRFLRLAIFNYSPYTFWNEVNFSSDSNAYFEHDASLQVDGTESKIFSLFCDTFNCSLEISLDEAGEWGEIFDNRTGNGIIGAVVERRADIGVGALYSWFHEFTFLTLSKPISRTGVTCITPKPKLLSSWMTPILPFTPNLWAAVAVTFVLASIFALFMNFMVNKIVLTQDIRVDICESFMIIGSMFILQTVLLRINRNKYVSQMVLIGSVLFVGMMIGNVYSGGLSSVMTIPRYQKPIDTLLDLANSDLHWASTHDAWIFSILMATQPTILKLLQNFETHPKEVLHRHAIQQDLAYSVERLPYGHFAIGEYIDRDVSHNFHLMIEDIYWENCVAMSTKTWPMMDHLDGLILRVFESGIQRYWELQVVSKYADNKVQLTIATSRHQESSGPTILQPSHLVGAFLLLTFGLASGFMIFVMEIAVGKLHGAKWFHRD